MTATGRAAAVCILLASSSPAFGQAAGGRAFEVGGGYAFVGSAAAAEGFGPGWFVDGGWRAASWLYVVGEAARHQRRQGLGFVDLDTAVESVAGGVRVLRRHRRFTPYAQVLAAAVRVKRTRRLQYPVGAVDILVNAHAGLQLGGGIQMPLTRRVAVRIGADYRRISDTYLTHDHRFFTGAVYAFGGR